MTHVLGVDVGSCIGKAVLLNDELAVVARASLDTRTLGTDGVRRLLADLFGDRRRDSIKIGVTGAGRDLWRWPEGSCPVNEIVALAQGARHECPRARSILEVGGQTARWAQLDDQGEILDFALNEKCAAGSGAFLEQQAGRLALSMADFSRSAASARRAAKIAGRCSVFAKSDMVHLQQKGTPVEEMAYGLCQALVRNFVATALRGKECLPPVLFTGGGALNPGLARAFRELLGMAADEWIVSPEPLSTCALGAALVAARQAGEIEAAGVHVLAPGARQARPHGPAPLAPLGQLSSGPSAEPVLPETGDIECFLGVDVGSVSTDLALLDLQGNVLAGSYVPTAGRPLKALQEAYAALAGGFKGRLTIKGIGTTGSGRHLAGQVLRSDVVHNEITCQMKSAVRYFPEADTVFEIGGQDSKFIAVDEGRIVDFCMNKICAAGTGSFLEEQAGLLGISIVGQFSDLAERSAAPHDLGTRCTVFMESELVNALSRGVPVPDLVAGLAYSVARNYLEKVVAPRPVGRKVVFQGGVASNAAVVQAFSSILGQPVSVHPYNRISGAIGAALMALEASSERRGLPARSEDLAALFQREYRTDSFECRHCSNRCDVSRIALDGETAYFGDTCERYTSGTAVRPGRHGSPETLSGPGAELDLIAERARAWEECVQAPEAPRGVVGIPRVSYVLDYLPFWAAFFRRLGYAVRLSPASDMEMFSEGLKKLPAEVCLPAKMAFGHLLWLERSGVPTIFFPSVLQFEGDADGATYPCPYGEHLPFMGRSALGLELLAPDLDFKDRRSLLRGLRPVAEALGCGPRDAEEALDEAAHAYRQFQRGLVEKGRAALEAAAVEHRPVFVLLGRPYNIYDSFLNMNLARHLKKLGAMTLPFDCVPMEEDPLPGRPILPSWKYNRAFIRAARWALARDDAFPVVITNFGCGPDAFGLKHVARILGSRPHLVLEFDEHRAEAGMITRLEAFWDEVRAFRGERASAADSAAVIPRHVEDVVGQFREKKVYLPCFADQAHVFVGALKAVGVEAELLPPPDPAGTALGEKCSTGKECHAYAIVTGDLVKLARAGVPRPSIFYFPGSANACLLQQYGASMDYLLRDLGVSNLRVIAPEFPVVAEVLGLEGLKWLWRGLVAVDDLVKASCSIRPYELKAGLTDEMHRLNLADIEEGLSSRDLRPALARSAERLRAIRVRREPRPLIGIAGDVYTRYNRFANHSLYHRLEAMGCEVWPPPFMVDEAEFGARTAMASAARDLRLPELASNAVLRLRMELERFRVRRVLDQQQGERLVEPEFKEIVADAGRYLGRDNNALVLLNVAKMVDYSRRGADGIVNVICFNCMLGTVGAALAEGVRRDHDHIPIATLVYSGAPSAEEQTRLEAFVHQVKRFAARRRASGAAPRREVGPG